MTQEEAECFCRLRQWQRRYIFRKMRDALVPRPRWFGLLASASALTRIAVLFLAVLLSPLLLLIWLINILRALIVLPFALLASHIRPRNLRAPGERNIKGVHYQFARHIDLPPDLYIRCVDDWVSILYGEDKLPTFSLSNYLNADYILRRKVAFEKDDSLQRLIKTQISNAREELSKELGHY